MCPSGYPSTSLLGLPRAFIDPIHSDQCLQGFYEFSISVNRFLKASKMVLTYSHFTRLASKGGLYRPLPRYRLTPKTASEGICGGTSIVPNVYRGFVSFPSNSRQFVPVT